MCGSQAIQMLDNVYAGTGTNEVPSVQSGAVANSGNAAVATYLIVNTAGTITVTLKLQGSYNKIAWDDITSTTSSGGLDYKVLTATAVKYPYLRVEVTVSGTTVKALVRAWLALSCQ
jgi:hypothetical protein